MKTQAERKTNLSFPVGLYFRQFFASDRAVKFINPFSFWHQYKIDYLETCWQFDPIRFLERCRQIN